MSKAMSSFTNSDLQTRVKLFKSSLETLFVLTNVEDEQTKKRMLLGSLGTELEALIAARCAPRDPADLRYAELLTLLEKEPASPEQMKAHVQLFNARRTPGEPLRAWAERLQALAAAACVGPGYRVVLRDLFLMGLGKTQLQQRLLCYGLDLNGDLDTALQVALQLEDDDHSTIQDLSSFDDAVSRQEAPK